MTTKKFSRSWLILSFLIPFSAIAGSLTRNPIPNAIENPVTIAFSSDNPAAIQILQEHEVADPEAAEPVAAAAAFRSSESSSLLPYSARIPLEKAHLVLGLLNDIFSASTATSFLLMARQQPGNPLLTHIASALVGASFWTKGYHSGLAGLRTAGGTLRYVGHTCKVLGALATGTGWATDSGGLEMGIWLIPLGTGLEVVGQAILLKEGETLPHSDTNIPEFIRLAAGFVGTGTFVIGEGLGSEAATKMGQVVVASGVLLGSLCSGCWIALKKLCGPEDVSP